MAGGEFLPGKGRWQPAGLTEGAIGSLLPLAVAPGGQPPPPSATVPLPVPGRIRA